MSGYQPRGEVGTEDKKKSMSGVIFHGLNCPCCQSTPYCGSPWERGASPDLLFSSEILAL